MTKEEFRQKLDSLTESEFQKFRSALGGDGSTRFWYVDGFVRKPEVHERLYADYFNIPTEQDRVNQATIGSADAAKVSSEASVASARHAREANEIAQGANRLSEKANRIAKEALKKADAANATARWNATWTWAAAAIALLALVISIFGK